jgi:hypothetical protein
VFVNFANAPAEPRANPAVCDRKPEIAVVRSRELTEYVL